MRLLLYCLLLLLPFTLLGQRPASLDDQQFDFNPFRDRDKKLKEALYPGIVLIQQRYALVDKDGNEFGQNNLPYFSTTYQVGAFSASGTLLPEMTNTPGANDTAFTQYKDEYTTVTTNMAMRPIADSAEYEEVELKSYNDKDCVIEGKTEVAFNVVSHADVTEGKLLVFSFPPGADREKTVPKVTVAAIDEVEWANGVADIKDVFVKDGEVIGGVFFNEKIAFATLTYELVGFYEVKDGNWYIKSIDDSKANTLSPIKKKK